ncbi:pupal cuticle protein C1B-like [Athalia rosae]|uniref:pupal cuticle protein C1B-like n=1 Tax=Athalia rosae TaxID=37344 RepID=UPI0020337501|nr:pupal cuticle protein C1B-like [Athalia rosae]
MALKFFLLATCFVAAANAGLTLTSTSDNTYRSLGNLAQVSTQSKTIDTPYSSSSKSDIRVSNPAVYASPAPLAHYAPAPQLYQQYSSPHQVQHYAHAPAPVHQYQNSPVYTSAPGPVIAKSAPLAGVHYAHAAPVAVHQQIYAPQPAHVAYAQPQYHHAQPAPLLQYAQHHHAVAAAPAHVSYAASPAAPAGHQHQSLVGVAYSPANTVAHLTYSNVNDHVNYAW